MCHSSGQMLMQERARKRKKQQKVGQTEALKSTTLPRCERFPTVSICLVCSVLTLTISWASFSFLAHTDTVVSIPMQVALTYVHANKI